MKILKGIGALALLLLIVFSLGVVRKYNFDQEKKNNPRNYALVTRQEIVGLASVDGELFTITKTGDLYRLDPATGESEHVGLVWSAWGDSTSEDQ